MHLGHPAESFGKRAAAFVVAKPADDLIEVFPLDGARSGLLTLESGLDCFEKPQDFLNGLTWSLLEEEAISLIQ